MRKQSKLHRSVSWRLALNGRASGPSIFPPPSKLLNLPALIFAGNHISGRLHIRQTSMMRLINTVSGEMQEHLGQDLPKYGILSHRWGHASEELSFQEYRRTRRDTPGNRKVMAFLKAAANDGLQWGWVDTCCIDKASSAELSESINSMFLWYNRASKCYVFLHDVQDSSTWRTSTWWKRGWTLQELVAPSHVAFYDMHWHAIGTKAQWAEGIQNITRVPMRLLGGEQTMNSWTVAQRLSWAADRKTERLEDRAYSLLGLFDIHMPVLYGEGIKAFRRLQLELLRKYPDDSVFSWKSRDRRYQPQHVLASSPDDFHGCSKMKPYSLLKYEPPMFSPPQVTSWGIALRANAHKLRPKDGQYSFTIDGRSHQFLWALRMMVAWRGNFEELPSVLLLVQNGPARYGYRRLDCLHLPWHEALACLKASYAVGDLEENTLLYLQFDDTLD